MAADAQNVEKFGMVYKMRTTLEATTMTVAGRQVPLAPGMAVTAEIKTGQRRVIEFFLAPLLRYGQEGLRER